MTDFAVENKLAAGNWTCLSVYGRMDAVTAAEAEKKIWEGFAGSKRFALDLSQVDYISCAGLRVLLRLAKAADIQQKELCLLNVHSQVKAVLEDSGMDEYFNLLQLEDLRHLGEGCRQSC